MPLSAGEKLGPYLILEKIGAGGMGEVYRARDERLGRDVALKVSGERFNERFEREARLIAALNHPNICSLFDVGSNYLVMELIDGPTLAERIAEGPIPMEEALHIASQIAEALQVAHDSGIIHRDLKPGNIKIRPDGTVKVLDFGLAKSGVADSSSASPADSPTLSTPATQAGMILGTAAYMSPEQARGKPVDKRADIWAFGAVLYEMVTGQQLFQGEDVSHTLASVIMKEPDLDPVPSRVKQVLRRCLEKDPKKRLRDISGVALLLESEAAAVPFAATSKPRASRIWPGVAAIALAVAAVSLIYSYRSHPGESALRPLIRLNVDLGPHVVFNSSQYSSSNVIISPDGQRLAYISQGRIYTQLLNQSSVSELPDTSGAFGAFFSSDGNWIGFFAGGRLRKIAVDGGAAVDLGAVILAATSRGGTWTEDGKIIAAMGSTGALSSIPEGGGTAVKLTELAEGELTHRWPEMVPGSQALIYTAHNGLTSFDYATIKVRSLINGQTKTLQQGGTAGLVVQTPRGNYYFLYVNRSALYAAPFDVKRLELTGSAVPVLDGVGVAPSGAAEMDISRDGTLIYRSTGGELLTVQWMDSSGKTDPLLAKPGVYGRPSLSPDGERLALEIQDSGNSDLYVYESKRDILTRLTFEKTPSAGPVWSPDGSYIVYQDVGGISWIRSTGGEAHPLIRGKGLQFPWSFTPDGKRLAYMEVGKGGYDLWTVTIDGDPASGIKPGKPESLLLTDADERYPSISPDGKWFAYASAQGGAFEVFVRAFPDTGAKWQISSFGGGYPMWSRLTHELLFETQEAQIMSAAWSVKNDSFVPEKTRPWSPKLLANMVNSVRNVTLAPDGKRVAALFPSNAETGVQSHVFFLLNFFDELERRIPPKK